MEISIFCVVLLLFFSFPSDMDFMYLHLLHPIRGFIGLEINKKLPKSHDILREFKDMGEEKIKFEEFIGNARD